MVGSGRSELGSRRTDSSTHRPPPPPLLLPALLLAKAAPAWLPPACHAPSATSAAAGSRCCGCCAAARRAGCGMLAASCSCSTSACQRSCHSNTEVSPLLAVSATRCWNASGLGRSVLSTCDVRWRWAVGVQSPPSDGPNDQLVCSVFAACLQRTQSEPASQRRAPMPSLDSAGGLAAESMRRQQAAPLAAHQPLPKPAASLLLMQTHLASPQQVAGQHAASTHVQHACQRRKRPCLPNLEPGAHWQCWCSAAAPAGATAAAAAGCTAAGGTSRVPRCCRRWAGGRLGGRQGSCIALGKVLPQACQVGFAVQRQAVLQHVLRLGQASG